MNWKKTIRRTILIVLATIVILAGAACVAVHTRPVEQLLRSKAVEVAEARTGTQVAINRIVIHWANLGADLYGVTVYGKGGPSQPPLFQSTHLGVELKIDSLLRGQIAVADLVLDRPVLHLEVNEQGQTNLPKSSAGAAKSSSPVKTLFDLAFRHLAINNGQIHYNDEKIPLSAELADVAMRVNFDTLSSEYRGSVDYGRGRIVFKKYNPIEHSLQASFVASRAGLTVDPLIVKTPKSSITAQATLADYANPRIQGQYEMALYTPEIAQVLKNSSLPAGEIVTKGTMRYESAAGGSLLDGLRVDGSLRSAQLALHTGQVRAELEAVRGAYTLERGKLGIPNLQADALGGHLSVKSGVLSLTGRSASRLNATFRGVSLEDVSAALNSGKYERYRVVGRADAEAEISWSRSLRDLVVESHMRLYAPQARTAEREIPLNGVVDVRYDRANDSASFGKSYLRIGNTRLSLNGTLSERSNLSVQLRTSDVHDLSELVAQEEAAAKSGQAPASAPLDLHGSVQFTGRVFGSPDNPQLRGHLAAQNVQAEGTLWRSIAMGVDVSASEVALTNGTATGSGREQLTLNASAGLQHWSFAATSPVSIEGAAKNVSVASLEKLAKANYPVGGVLSASFSVHGTRQNPAGHGAVQIVKATAWNQPIEHMDIDFQGNGNSIQSAAKVQTTAGDLSADLTYVPRSKQYQISVNAPGVYLNKIQAVEARNLGIEGKLAMSASGSGTLQNPELSANLTVSELQVRGQSISRAQANLAVARRHASFTARLTVDQGNIEAKGDVALTGAYDATATLDVRALSLGPLVTRYVSMNQPELKGRTDLHAEISGPLTDADQIESHVEISTLNLAYRGAEIGLVGPLRLEYRNGVATIQRTELKGTGTELRLQGTIPVKKNAPVDVALNGTVDLSLLQGMTEGINSSGRLELQFAARGELSNPMMEGNIRLEKARLSSASIPVGLDGVNGQIHFSGDRIEITSLTGTVGGGAMSAQGFVIYGPHPNFNLSLQAKDMRVRYPEGLRTLLNCNVRLDGTTANSLLSGRVIIDQLAFTQQLDLASLAGQFASGSGPTSPSAFEKNMKLNLSIQSAQNLRLASSQLSIQGAANLTLTGTLANPVVLGRATLGGGEIFFLGRRYEIQSGTLEFANPVRNNPVVNIYANTSVEQYKITINFVGPVDRLRTNYTSDPPLPPPDIINLIAFGETSEQAATSPSTPAALGAESVLAKGVTSQVSGKIQKLAGISQLTINPLIGNSQQNPGAQIAIQQRVTGSLLLTFTTDTTQTQSTTVQVQYRMSPSISISALRDQNGGYGVDVHFHKSF
jgi:translocation and assembly module TamB